MSIMIDLPPAMAQEAQEYATVRGTTLERMLFDYLKGGSSFTCTGGVRPSAATLSVADDALTFTYKLTGGMFLIR